MLAPVPITLGLARNPKSRADHRSKSGYV